MASQRGESAAPAAAPVKQRKGLDKSHYLYIAVIVAVVLGAVVGLMFPEVGKSLKPLGDGFIKLIKMMIAPVIFCTILLGIIPEDIPVLPTLLAAIMVGFALQKMGPQGAPILKAIGHGQALVFRILIMIMWLAPVGAFGAIAAVVGATGFQAIISMFTLMIAFYITCALFIVVILGGLLQVVTGVNIFKLMRYLAREYLLIF